MIKKRIYVLILCFFCGVSVIVIMYGLSVIKLSEKNGFIRLLPSHKVTGINFIDIQWNSWYISGIFNRSVYLGNNPVPGRVLKVDSSLVKSNEFNLLGFEKLQIHKGSTLAIDSPFVYIMDGIKPIVLKGKVFDFRLTEEIEVPYFTRAIPISENSFMARSVYKDIGNVLLKHTAHELTSETTKLLEKQVDGIFCTDGEMVKVSGSSKMIYVYYYRNQFLCADSNLNLLYKGKTIDTVNHAQIKIAQIKSTGETTMAAPPLYVNKRACANSKYLFVQSALRANNETEYMIKDVSMIDVYAISDGKYQFSFYLPDFRGFKVRDFKVYGQSLYALYDHYLYKYQLNF